MQVPGYRRHNLTNYFLSSTQNFHKKGNTPLHLCSMTDSVKAEALLFAAGANINILNPNGHNPISIIEIYRKKCYSEVYKSSYTQNEGTESTTKQNPLYQRTGKPCSYSMPLLFSQRFSSASTTLYNAAEKNSSFFFKWNNHCSAGVNNLPKT